MIDNQALRYIAVGLTADEGYLVIVDMPIDASILPNGAMYVSSRNAAKAFITPAPKFTLATKII